MKLKLLSSLLILSSVCEVQTVYCMPPSYGACLERNHAAGNYEVDNDCCAGCGHGSCAPGYTLSTQTAIAEGGSWDRPADAGFNPQCENLYSACNTCCTPTGSVNTGISNTCEVGEPITVEDECRAATLVLSATSQFSGFGYKETVSLDYAPNGCFVYDGDPEYHGFYLNTHAGSATGTSATGVYHGSDHHKVCKAAAEWRPVFNTRTGYTMPLDMDALDDLIIYRARMCLGAPATGTYNCVPLTEDDASNLPGYINPELNSNLKRMIAVLSGKGLSRVPEWYCPDWDDNAGACTMPESGKIFNKRIGVERGSCEGSNCWACAAAEQTPVGGLITRPRYAPNGWHAWGYGVTLSFNAEGTSATLSNPDFGDCEPTWTEFFIQVVAIDPTRSNCTSGATCAMGYLCICATSSGGGRRNLLFAAVPKEDCTCEPDVLGPPRRAG